MSLLQEARKQLDRFEGKHRSWRCGHRRQVRMEPRRGPRAEKRLLDDTILVIRRGVRQKSHPAAVPARSLTGNDSGPDECFETVEPRVDGLHVGSVSHCGNPAIQQQVIRP